jgi:hypothetical protein
MPGARRPAWICLVLRDATGPAGALRAMTRVVEIRVYELRDGTSARYEQLLRDEAAPLLARHGIDVVAFGTSLDEANRYYLIRAFDSLPHRAESEQAFYSSKDWRDGPREAVLALIKSYVDLVLELDEDAIAGLRRRGSGPTSQRIPTGLAEGKERP